MNGLDTIYAIILNYNNAIDTIECIKSAKNIRSLNIKIILVDNGSDKKCIDILETNIDNDVVFIKNNKNIGYAAGNNVGISYAIANGAQYIAIVNNDVILNENTFQGCIERLHDSRVGIVGPAILEFGSNYIQSCGAMVNKYTVQSTLINRGNVYKKSDSTISCDYIGGACLVFKPSLVTIIGYLPEIYFLFWEETEWCLKAKKAGLSVECVLSGNVEHKGSATIKQVSGISNYYMERNRIIFMKRNYKNIFVLLSSFMYLIIKNLYKSLFISSSYFEYFKYYYDGIIGRDKYNKKKIGGLRVS